jgi:hypothetical protein
MEYVKTSLLRLFLVQSVRMHYYFWPVKEAKRLKRGRIYIGPIVTEEYFMG